MTHGFSFQIEKKLFDTFPDLKVLLIFIKNIQLDKEQENACMEQLEDSWKNIPNLLSSYPNAQSHPNIAIWREAYGKLKISVKKFTSSIENLAKRASKVDSKPLHINPLVDYYNSVSLKYLVPFGGFDIDSVSELEGLQLRYSKEGDTFLALDSESSVEVPPGEAVYAFGNVVSTRHINWKQSKEGLIMENSKNIVLMSEILQDSSVIELIKTDMKNFCQSKLNIEPEFFVLNRNEISYVDNC